MRFEQDTSCRGTHCASTPLPISGSSATSEDRARATTKLKEDQEVGADVSLLARNISSNVNCPADSLAVTGLRSRRYEIFNHLHHYPHNINYNRDCRESEINVIEGAKTGLRGVAGGPGMAYPAPAAALNQHSPFSTISNNSGTATSGNGNSHLAQSHLPAPAAPRPTDFSVSSLLTAANSHPPLLGGSSSQGSASPPPGGPGSPAAAPETPPPHNNQRELSHPSSAEAAAANYFNALAAAGFCNPHLPPTSSPNAHHLQGKSILSSPHHHPQFNLHGLTPQGERISFMSWWVTDSDDRWPIVMIMKMKHDLLLDIW